MNTEEYRNELSDLAYDIATAMKAGAGSNIEVLAGLDEISEDCTSPTDKVNVLFATGHIMRDFVNACEGDLKRVLDADNEASHARVMQAIGDTFGVYASDAYRKELLDSCAQQKANCWYQQTLAIKNESFLSWLLNQAARQGIQKKSMDVMSLYTVGDMLISMAEAMEE